MLVGFGQLICLPVGPRCDLCSLASVPNLCPSQREVSKARQASSSPRKGFSYPPKKEEEAEEKIVVEGQDGIGVIKTEEAEVAIESEIIVTPRGEDTEERRILIKEEPTANGGGVDIETEAVISTIKQSPSKDLTW